MTSQQTRRMDCVIWFGIYGGGMPGCGAHQTAASPPTQSPPSPGQQQKRTSCGSSGGHCRCTIRAAAVTSYIDTAITKPSRDSCKLHSTLRLRITYRNSRGKKSTLYNISHHIHTSQQAPDVKTTHVFVFCVRKTSK